MALALNDPIASTKIAFEKYIDATLADMITNKIVIIAVMLYVR